MEPQKGDQTWLRGKRCLGEAKQRAKGHKEGSESKRMISQGNERAERPHREAEDLGWNLDSARSYCLLWAPVSTFTYWFIHVNYGGDGLTEMNRTVSALQGLVRVNR